MNHTFHAHRLLVVASILALCVCMSCATPSLLNRTYGFIRVANVTMPTISGKAISVNYTGMFVRDTITGAKVDGGTLSIAGASIPQFTDGSLVQYRLASRDGSTTDGRHVVVSVGGDAATGIPAFTDSVYVPKAFILTAPAFDLSAHNWIGDRSEGMTLTWNADTSIDVLEVRLDYMGLSGSGDVGDSIKRYWWVRTEDDGSYTIPSSVLHTFTSNTRHVKLTILRENEKVVTVSGKKFLLRGDAHAAIPVKLID